MCFVHYNDFDSNVFRRKYCHLPDAMSYEDCHNPDYKDTCDRLVDFVAFEIQHYKDDDVEIVELLSVG